jgi:hypothetical protein
MRIGIGLGTNADPARAAAEAVRQARRGVDRPALALVLGGIGLDQKRLNAALRGLIDPNIMIGGSSYAEITPAGVTRNSVAVLFLDFDGLKPRIVKMEHAPDQNETGLKLAEALGTAPRGGAPLGFIFSSYAVPVKRGEGWLRVFQKWAPGCSWFGGYYCGDYDAGLGGASVQTYQYGPGRPEISKRLFLGRFVLMRESPNALLALAASF